MIDIQDKVIKNIQKNTGISINLINEVPAAKLNVNESKFSIYTAEILKTDVNVLFFRGNEIKWATNMMSRVSKVNNWNNILIVTQLKKSDRQILLEKQVAFITAEGEMFLPFLGTRLFPNQSNLQVKNEKLSPVGQRLYMFILFMLLLLEKNEQAFIKMNDKKIMDTDGVLFTFKGGQNFYDSFGRMLEINNRMSFLRAADDLIAHGLLKSSGSTLGKKYTTTLGAEKYFKAGINYLESPVGTKKLNLGMLDSQKIEIQNKSKFMKSGFTALSEVTMIEDNQWKTLVTDKVTFNSNFRDMSSIIDDFNNELKFSIQIEKYNLRFFNVLYRRVDKEYPHDIIDPLNLYLMFFNENNDVRVFGELEDMLDNVWRN